MYCVVQEVELKKPNKYGYSKELKSCFMQMSIDGIDMSHYYYTFSNERFERPVKKAYKISIHQSYRENGKVNKKQYVLNTVNYYDFADGWFSLYDYCHSKIDFISNELDVDVEIIYNMVEAKLNPLIEEIQAEFEQTEEYKTHEEHEDITTLYALRKTQFGRKYNCDSSVYDCIYDVFGNLMNKEKLEEVKRDYKDRKEYEQKSRSYQDDFYSNYSKYFTGSGGSSYADNNYSNHNSEDKEMYKQFYRVLSKKFHPDANPDKDTSNEMKLLNQLKTEWNL